MAIDQTDIKDLNEKVLLEFEAYDRPHKVWTKEFYSSVIVIAFLVSVILYFIEGMMPVLVIWALVFMLWAMAKTEPKMVKVSFTSWGLRATEKVYRYEEMVNFWFETKWGSRLMRINLSGIPWHLVVVIDSSKEEEIKALIGKDVVYLEPETTWIDRVIKWVGEKMPLE